jgi:hypothetical protein
MMAIIASVGRIAGARLAATAVAAIATASNPAMYALVAGRSSCKLLCLNAMTFVVP